VPGARARHEPAEQSIMANILAVYGTAYGQTERIVLEIARVLRGMGHKVTTIKGDRPDGFSFDGVDAVLVAASVLYGRHQRYIREFTRRYAANLNALPSAFVSVSGAAAGQSPEGRRQAQECVDRLLEETGWRPRLVELVAGAMAYTRYDPVTRWIIKLISRRKGGPTDTSRDHELTDWQAVDRFARRFGEVVGERAPAGVAGG
jgi:menaquinone-dependent protoporphyrinogen oxidase